MESNTAHDDTVHRGANPVALRARPSGLTGSTLVLEDDRGNLGTLTMTSPGEVRLEGSGLIGEIEQSISGYRANLGETEIIVTRRRGTYELRSEDIVYEARLEPLRNSARATSSDGGRIEVKGGLLSRSYDVVYEGDTEGIFEIAVLLLYMTANLKRRAFTA